MRTWQSLNSASASHPVTRDSVTGYGWPANRLRPRPNCAAQVIYRQLADSNPAAVGFRGALANGHRQLGLLVEQTGKLREAEAEYRSAISIYRELATENPTDTQFRNHLAESHASLGSAACTLWSAGRSGGRAPRGDGDLSEARGR